MKHVTVRKKTRTGKGEQQFIWKFSKNTLLYLLFNTHPFTEGIVFDTINNILKQQLQTNAVYPDLSMFEFRDKAILGRWRHSREGLTFDQQMQLKMLEKTWKNLDEQTIDKYTNANNLINDLEQQIQSIINFKNK